MKRFSAVLAQLTPKLRDVEGNIEAARSVLSRHAAADLIVFPELSLGGYTTSGVANSAVSADGERLS